MPKRDAREVTLCWCILLLSACAPVSLTYAQVTEDLDSDGVVDNIDLDQDNDGIVNELEGVRRLADLNQSPAHYFAVVPDASVARGVSRRYNLLSSEDGQAAALTGSVLSSNTEIEWSMQGEQPRLRNLSSGVSTVQWSVTNTGERQVSNIDLTVSDLDGLRSETVAVSTNAVVGYSLSLNSNIVVRIVGSQLTFTGTGEGGDSLDDLVTLHFRDTPDMLLTYSNSLESTLASTFESTTVANITQTEVLSSDVSIAGYRHSLGYHSSTHFTPVTRVRDTDADGVADHRDLDSDNDGLGDVAESDGIDADGNNLIDGAVDERGISVLANRDLSAETVFEVYQASNEVGGDDADGDGLLSSVDPLPGQFGGALTSTDSDNDGLEDLDEIRIYQTNPNQADTDGDDLNDGDELNHFNTNPLESDTDSDGLSDGDEINLFGTMPIVADSDSDGFSDQQEINNGTDPLVSNRIVVVTPAPVLIEPDPVQLTEPVQDIELVEVTEIGQQELAGSEPLNVEPVAPGALVADDEIVGNQSSLRTGLSGFAGCTIISIGAPLMGTKPDPGLPVMLMLALAGLTAKRRPRINNA